MATNRFSVLADCDHPKSKTRFDIRYEPNKSSNESSTRYRNYIDLDLELPKLDVANRRGIIASVVARLSNPLYTGKESDTRILMYHLRLQSLVWAFFGPTEFSEIINKDLSRHPGYDEVHTERESSILCGFFDCITQFKQGKIFGARATFTSTDKAFGELRHSEWLFKNKNSM